MTEATPAGYKWLDPSFQSHHQRQAERIIDVYANLAIVAEEAENLNSRALAELGEGLFAALNHHAWAKCRIPSKSLWFRRRPKHKQWLLASHSEVQMARATDTALQPEMVPDPHWFEADVSRVLVRVVKRLASRADLGGLVKVLSAAQQYALSAAVCGGGEEALSLIQSLGRELNGAFAVAKFDVSTKETVTQSLNRLAAVDLHALAVLNVLLGTSRAVESADRVTFEQRMNKICWGKIASLYDGRFPREVLTQLEEMREWLEFEREVEGVVVTPRWLQLEVAALGYARFASAVVQRIISEFELCYGVAAEQRAQAGDHIGAASLITRGLEAANKFDAHLNRIRAWWDALLELNRSRDWQWPTLDVAALNQRGVALRDRLVKQLAACTGSLIDLPEEKRVPDLFGQTYSILADTCFDALIRGDDGLFKAIFPAYFLTAIEAHQKVRGSLDKISNLNISTVLGPLSDLLAISGFAELYSALSKKPFDTECRKMWDAYFDTLKDDQHRQAAISMLSLIKEPRVGMSSRDVLRFRWTRATRDYLREQRIAADEYGFSFRTRRTPTHPSPLVRVFAARGDVLNDPEDIFFAVYLFRRSEAARVKVPREIDSYQKALRREEARTGAHDDNE